MADRQTQTSEALAASVEPATPIEPTAPAAPAALTSAPAAPAESAVPAPARPQKAPVKQNPAARYRVLFIVFGILLAVVAVVSVCLGRFPVTPAELLGILTGQSSVSSAAYTAVMQVRLPRVIVCVFVGAALSIAGASYQGLFQNPMVSQDILGASSGAAFGAALAILFGFGTGLITAFSFAFGVAAVAISWLISKASPSAQILSLILAGMVVSSLFSSGTSAIKLVADTEQALPAITYWLMGSLASIRMDDVLPTCTMLTVVSIPIVVLRWRINLLATGEEEAKSMGMNTQAMRLVVIGCATLLTAICVSVSGLIGWVGLIIPHFCRLIFGHDYRRIIPASLILGGSFLLVVDDLCRLLLTSEIPIGILTSFVGAPIFIYLIAKGGAYGKSKR